MRFSYLLVLSMLALPLVASATCDDRPGAKVNGAIITQGEVTNLFETLPVALRGTPLASVYPQVLERSIEGTLIYQRAVESDITSDPDVQRRITLYRQRAIQEVYLERAAAALVDEADIKNEYARLKKAFNADKHREAKVRFLIAATAGHAETLGAKLKAGALFEELVQSANDFKPPLRLQEVGYVRQGDFNETINQAIFSTKAGTTHPNVIGSEDGYLVIMVEDIRALTPPSLDEVRPAIQRALVQAKIPQVVSAVKRDATIERYSYDGRSVINANGKKISQLKTPLSCPTAP